MKVTEVRAAYPKWRQVRPADAWQAHFWQIAVRVVTDVGVVGHGYGGGGQPAVQVINDHLSRFWSGDRSATWWTQPAADAASAWTSSQPWYTTARPVNRTPGYCRASRWSVT